MPNQYGALALQDLSDEQRAIVEAAHAGKSLRIAAFAGTGKTTTLIAVAKALKHRRIRYIVFNRAQQTLASERFAKMGITNVTVTTAHSLARREFGAARYKDRIEKNDGVLVHSWSNFLNEKGAFKDFPSDVRPAIARCMALLPLL